MLDFLQLANPSDHTTVVIPSGVHAVSEPVVISGEDIHIVGEDGATLCGALPLTRSDFTEVEEGVLCATVSRPVDALFIDGIPYTMARYPKGDSPDKIFGGFAADCLSPEKVREWADPRGGYIHAMHSALWGGFSYEIDGKTEDGHLTYHGGWQNNRQSPMHEDYRFVENIREEMTRPGEWVYSAPEGKIYVRPLAGADLDQTEAVVNFGFLILENCRNVTVENLTFCRGSRTFMETKEPLLRSDWTICRKGAVLIRNSEGCRIDGCSFLDIGSNGVFVDGNCTDIAVTRSRFSGIGASAVCFVGHPSSVRSPLFEYGQTQVAEDMDKTPGPASEAYPKACRVEDCLIEYVGTTEKQATGVEISMSYGITVKNCTICHTSRAGINISEGTFGGHRIEGCDVFDTVRETGDHGSFNSWGRDRFWHLTDTPDDACGQYAGLDMLAPNVITRNRFRCDRGWDIDLDDGSSNYIITENLCLNGGLKLREGFCRVARSNILVNNSIHCHVWYPNSGEQVENNILFRPYPNPILMPAQWGRVDGNILHTPGQTTPSAAPALQEITGQDEGSICLDCDFTAPERSDYRPQSPHLTGFENFPIEFGVRYAPLRAIADTPVLPGVAEAQTEADEVACRTLDGATLRNIADDGEMTVYGTDGHTGALLISAQGAARARGLLVGDVIVGMDGKIIKDAADIPSDTRWSTGRVTILRRQRRMEL